jgi:hypothetical protein
MTDAPERIITNASGTMIITPPAIPLHPTDAEYIRADLHRARITALEADLKATLRREDDANRAAFRHLGKSQALSKSLSDASALIRRAQALIGAANFPWHEDAEELLNSMEAQNGQWD